MMKGVDISHYQNGLTIKQLADDGYSFAIIKLTEGNYLIDRNAFSFYQEAYTMGFPVGCYCYSHASAPAAARNEAKLLLETLNGFPMPCGVFLDIEEPKQLGLCSIELADVVRAWCDAICEAGYTPGVYGSEYNLWAKLNPDDLPEDALVWVARYGKSPDVPCDLWQSSDSGSVTGYSGKVDTDEARSDRFKAFVEGKPTQVQTAGATYAGNWQAAAILVLQMLMGYAGYWTSVDGQKSEVFFNALRTFVDDLEK